MGNWARYLTEIRSHDPEWRAAFEAVLGWILADGVITKRHFNSTMRAEHNYRVVTNMTESSWREPVGLYELRTSEAVLAAWPEIAAAQAEPACPFVGPSRGFLAWSIEDGRTEDARRFGLDSGRAGRGIVVDLGTAETPRSPPTILRTVELGPVLVWADRSWFLPDVRQVLKHASDLLLSDDDAYLECVRRAMARLPSAPRRGAPRWPPPRTGRDHQIEIWRYASSMQGGSQCLWFE
jgi:hypothetical protein